MLNSFIVVSVLKMEVFCCYDRASGTGQAGQAKTGPLFLHVMFGIDRYTVMVVKD